ncbi:hypothetical protein [Bacillus sp. AFS019443]|uniref:hypothetical protein n=1 Tax=Bacillus sp. AFS019443 TaxID=2034279 RepID=UPI0014825384|nr:hypothetical protein [Bacillus sp. AFS019443]
MVHSQANLYEISMSDGQELMWYHAVVKRGDDVFTFEIYQTCDVLSVFYVDQAGKRQMIASVEDMLTALVYEKDKICYRNIIGDAKWLLLDGMYSQRGMTKEEEAAFFYLKNHVLDEMALV